MHLLLTDIQWDDEGMGLEECRLPSSVLVINIPPIVAGFGKVVTAIDEPEIGEQLAEAFGFLHNGFKFEVFNQRHNTHNAGFFPERLAVMSWNTN